MLVSYWNSSKAVLSHHNPPLLKLKCTVKLLLHTGEMQVLMGFVHVAFGGIVLCLSLLVAEHFLPIV